MGTMYKYRQGMTHKLRVWAQYISTGRAKVQIYYSLVWYMIMRLFWG